MKTRVAAAAAVSISGLVHLSLWFGGYRDVDVIGAAFILNAVSGVVIAILLVRWRSWVPLLLAVGFGAATLGAFILTVTVGLFGFQESLAGCPSGPLRCPRWWQSWPLLPAPVKRAISPADVLRTLTRPTGR